MRVTSFQEEDTNTVDDQLDRRANRPSDTFEMKETRTLKFYPSGPATLTQNPTTKLDKNASVHQMSDWLRLTQHQKQRKVHFGLILITLLLFRKVIQIRILLTTDMKKIKFLFEKDGKFYYVPEPMEPSPGPRLPMYSKEQHCNI